MPPYAKWVLLREPRDAALLGALANVIGVSASFPFSHPNLPVVDRDEVERIAALAIAAVRR
ncbi:hypothetical protein OMP38_12490 [Cohnella ginsengisoli]|uniref:Uncharacterized protein n=1 Tax=Cohnella ginsengisoli TaxID=425004 RepID=A0A9X4KJX1_9BACL|nr:hypothetical protein [Cohnella ginsengisoli]MDG0791597.1 hypothetical protein [Cohnella ginsengisoli]